MGETEGRWEGPRWVKEKLYSPDKLNKYDPILFQTNTSSPLPDALTAGKVEFIAECWGSKEVVEVPQRHIIRVLCEGGCGCC